MSTVPLSSIPLLSPPRIPCSLCLTLCVWVCVTPTWPLHGKCHILSVGVKYECVFVCVWMCLRFRELSEKTQLSLIIKLLLCNKCVWCHFFFFGTQYCYTMLQNWLMMDVCLTTSECEWSYQMPTGSQNFLCLITSEFKTIHLGSDHPHLAHTFAVNTRRAPAQGVAQWWD